VIAVNFTEKLILIGGTAYAGEMKKSVFGCSIIGCRSKASCRCTARPILAQRRHRCLLRTLGHRQDHALGRCQPHADRRRRAWLVGYRGLQFRGRLLRQDDPPLARGRARDLRHHQALRHRARECRDGPETRELDLDDNRLAENSRGSYPIDFIPNASAENMGPVPQERRDADRRRLWRAAADRQAHPDQAMYHFLSGYTARVAGTEIGVTEPEATFSTCFGAPFMPRHPFGLRQLAQGADRQGNVSCWLVNTGWTGGKYGTAAACRSRRRARCSTPRSTAASTMPSSAPIPISASRCR
jgi:phosphoenolpyruvate carboxykinase (ATP)